MLYNCIHGLQATVLRVMIAVAPVLLHPDRYAHVSPSA
jgi:hypothetical protein